LLNVKDSHRLKRLASAVQLRPWPPSFSDHVYLGRFEQTKNETDWGAFKTPTLRNTAARAPYIHDGSFPTWKDALGQYIGGGNLSPHLCKEIHALDFLSFDECDDLLAFLDSLTAQMPDNVGPPPDLEVKRTAQNQ